VPEIYDAGFEALKKSGRIRAIGLKWDLQTLGEYLSGQ
jgi:hypothetical protein